MPFTGHLISKTYTATSVINHCHIYILLFWMKLKAILVILDIFLWKELNWTESTLKLPQLNNDNCHNAQCAWNVIFCTNVTWVALITVKCSEKKWFMQFVFWLTQIACSILDAVALVFWSVFTSMACSTSLADQLHQLSLDQHGNSLQQGGHLELVVGEQTKRNISSAKSCNRSFHTPTC